MTATEIEYFWQIVLMTMCVAFLFIVPTKIMYDWNRHKVDSSVCSSEEVSYTLWTGLIGGAAMSALTGFLFGLSISGIVTILKAWNVMDAPKTTLWVALGIDVAMGIILKIVAYKFNKHKEKK